jgi:hypothetical protein
MSTTRRNIEDSANWAIMRLCLRCEKLLLLRVLYLVLREYTLGLKYTPVEAVRCHDWECGFNLRVRSLQKVLVIQSRGGRE